ncbi:MAG: peptide chain release factor 1 [Hyphomicrobiales bacterium]|nr:MAG: peptide chain release factor 1 [Hyphomicrobiales bacterium]|tara:strand:+ start:3506 stop:4582 length:1077 start_codon:yes stop_codon:yes gene_type:complete
MLDDKKLDKILENYEDIQNQMLTLSGDRNKYAELAIEFSNLEEIAKVIMEYRAVQKEKSDLDDILSSDSEENDVVEMAKNEIDILTQKLEKIEVVISELLLPKDADDKRSVIIEIRAGTGGDEAALFAGDLARMYLRFADNNKWKVEVMHSNEGEFGGYKEFIANITGNNVYQNLKFESGVHRVQRVPNTESSGRIHTSAATVAVLPEVEEVDVKIEDKDIRIDVFRASGPGGQSVNTTDSAVRITHLPSGITVSQQDEKSQHRNREKALKVLRARLYEKEKNEMDQERASNRKLQVGSGDRSERIRTYNYPQGRVTDHRINLTLHKLVSIMESEGLQEIIDALIAEDKAQIMAGETK